MPGENGSVTATYNTRIVGHFSKGVDVLSNSKTPKINLHLKGIVSEPREEDFPDTSNNTAPRISFDKSVYDLGTIPFNGKEVYSFIFTNTGKEPLKIMNCVNGEKISVVEGNRQTVMPGEKGKITATVNTRSAGRFNTRIIVYSNVKVPKVIHVTGTVGNPSEISKTVAP